MFLFTQVPPVIAPQHNDGVVAIGSVVECIKYLSDHRISKGYRSQVSLNALFPLIVFLDVFKVSISSAALCFGSQIVEIAFPVSWRKLNFLNWKQVKIFLGYKPRLMRTINPASQKKWFVVLLAKFPSCLLYTSPSPRD